MDVEIVSRDNLQPLVELMLELWSDSSFDEMYENCKRLPGSEKETCYLMKEKESYIALFASSRNYNKRQLTIDKNKCVMYIAATNF